MCYNQYIIYEEVKDMTDKRFQHFPSGNNNITTILQPPVAAEAMQSSCPSSVTAMQKFMFEFGSDGNIHSVSFLGNLSHEDIRLMLESVRQELYADCGSAIHYIYIWNGKIFRIPTSKRICIR